SGPVLTAIAAAGDGGPAIWGAVAWAAAGVALNAATSAAKVAAADMRCMKKGLLTNQRRAPPCDQAAASWLSGDGRSESAEDCRRSRSGAWSVRHAYDFHGHVH